MDFEIDFWKEIPGGWTGEYIYIGWFQGHRFQDKTIASDLLIFGILFAKGVQRGSLLEQNLVCPLNVSESEFNERKCVTNMTQQNQSQNIGEKIQKAPVGPIM